MLQEVIDQSNTTSMLADSSEKQLEDELAEMLDLSLKKKKKKNKSKKVAEDVVDSASSDSASCDPSSVVQLDLPTYSYEDLLSRVTEQIHLNNPDLMQKSSIKIPPPIIVRVGSKKIQWSNFQETNRIMGRSSDHVFQYMMAELGTEGSIDGNKRLVIKGRFTPSYLSTLLTKYAIGYVRCNMCSSCDKTTLSRDSVSRLYFMKCDNCGSSRSVAPIKSGYHAQTRADRRALRK